MSANDKFSDDEDWDAEIEEESVDPNAPTVQMQSAMGTVTIRPAAMHRSNGPLIDVPVRWINDAETVSVYTSYDNFETPFPLGKTVDADGDLESFDGTLKLPPGRYLMRFQIDDDEEDFQVDEDLDVVYSLGNEYNQVTVADPNASDEEEDSDLSDWDDLDEQLPEKFVSGAGAQTQALFKDVKGTTGMVTISPSDMAAAAPKKGHNRNTSVKWDASKRAFVAATSKGHKKHAPSDSISSETKEDPDIVTTSNDPLFKSKDERERERRRRKKKRRKEKKRLEKKRAQTAKAKVGKSSGKADVSAIREEVVKREKEWREAWILHELKTQESREQEKEAMRAQFKQEREVWIAKLKAQADEANALRSSTLDLQKRLDQAESGVTLNQNDFVRKQEASEQQNKRLTEDLAAAQAAAQTAAEEARNAKAELAEQRRTSEAASAKLESEVAELRSASSNDKIAIDNLKRELADQTEELKTQRADYEKQVEEAKKMSELQAAATAKAASDNELKSKLEELNAQLAARGDEVSAARDEASAANKALAESKRNISTLEDQLNASKTETASTKEQVAAEAAKTAAAQAKIAEIEAAVSAAEDQLSAANTASQEKINALQADLDKKQTEVVDLTAQVEKLTKDAESREASFEREKEELNRQIVAAKSAASGLGEKVKALAGSAKAMRDILAALKETASVEVATLKASLESNKLFLLNSINSQGELLASTIQKYKKELSERRKYFNLVQELRGNIRVYCRIRPMLSHDEKRKTTQCVEFPENNTVVVKSEKKTASFEFDRVFAPGTTQPEVFKEVKALVQSAMDGYNVCIFAYGQTGSGKTHTMEGSPDDRGVNFRALSELFRIREEREEDYDYTITVSMVEIYNETIRDILTKEEKPLKMRKGPNGVFVENLTEWDVESEEDVIKAMKTGSSNRSVGVTNMNEHSSRSHSILSVHVTGKNHTAGISYFGKLHLIDLAGSERLAKSGATGQRLKEAQAINKSLSALGNVMESLQTKSKHVPYRDSKLTFMLQDSLGGHAKTLMFINTSPALFDADETLQSLTFATRVAKVELGPTQRNVKKSSKKADAKK